MPRPHLVCAVVPALVLVLSCSTTGGRVAAELGSAMAQGVGRAGGTPERKPWSASPGRCQLFGEYQMACPVLPDCKGMVRDQAPVINACDSGSGFLKPVRVCTDWHGNAYWCASGAFPKCDGLRGTACGTMETLVCDDDSGVRRVLTCCGAMSSVEGCPANRYYEPRRRDDAEERAALQSDGGLSNPLEAGAFSAEGGDGDGAAAPPDASDH